MKIDRFTFLGMILMFEIPNTHRGTKPEYSDKMEPAVDQSLYPEDAKGVVRIPVFLTFSLMRCETVGRIADISKIFLQFENSILSLLSL